MMRHTVVKFTGILCALLLSSCAMPEQNGSGHAAIQKTLDSIGGFLGGGGASTASSAAKGGKMVSINAANIMIEGVHPSDARWSGKLISQTPLYHFFDSHIRGAGDNWPRVAIRIDDYSETLVPPNSGIEMQYMSQMPGSSQPNLARPVECLKFTAVIWYTLKKSERIENVVHCNADIRMNEPTLSVGALANYASLTSPASVSSGQIRSFGPKSPSKLLPDYTQQDNRLYTSGRYLFGSLFTQLGYRGPLDGDPRLWFVNLAQKTN